MRTSIESGFSLIEVLVSILVLSIGAIGTAAMQMTALRTAQHSTMQSNALHLATEMADRMRANTALMRQSDTHNPYLNIDYRFSDADATVGASDCYSTTCDAAQLASFDIAGWLHRIDMALPGARVRICRDGSPAESMNWDCSAAAHGTISIKIGWRDKEESSEEKTSDMPRLALTVAPYTQ